MLPVRKILVPVDFSPASDYAARMAVRIAAREGAAVTLLHVDVMPGVAAIAVEPIYVPPHLFAGLHEEHERRLDARLAALTEELGALAPAGVAIDSVREMASVAEGIVDHASESQSDLIVMGSHGHTGASRILLGSVASKVSRSAPCPVLVTRGDHDAPAHDPFSRVLAAIDYSDLSVMTARSAARIVAAGGTLELMHAWYPPALSALQTSLGGYSGDISSAIEDGRAAQGEMLAAFADENEISGEFVRTLYIASGSATSAIIARAENTKADLIVVGSHGRSGVFETVIGTVADRVISAAKVPVLLIPRRWATGGDAD